MPAKVRHHDWDVPVPGVHEWERDDSDLGDTDPEKNPSAAAVALIDVVMDL